MYRLLPLECPLIKKNSFKNSMYRLELKKELYVPPIAFGVSFNLQSQSLWSVFDGTWQKRHKELDYPTKEIYVQPIAFDVLFHLNLQSQSDWSLFNGTWQKRPRKLDYHLRFEVEEMTLHVQ